MKRIVWVIFVYLLLVLSCGPIPKNELSSVSNLFLKKGHTQQKDNVENLDEITDKINEVFQEIGLKRAYVQEEDGKIVLKGIYKNYDEFLSAYMIAQAVAGVSKVNPAFDVVKTNILIRDFELCTSFIMVGKLEKCPTFINIEEAKSGKQYDKIAILIGVGNFQDKKIPPLGSAPINDVNLVIEKLKRKNYKIYKLINEDATLENVKRTISKAVGELKNGGTLFIYASSHGAPKSPQGETGIVMYDTKITGKACNTLKNVIYGNKAIKSRDIIITANNMCNFLENSLTLSEDILPIVNSSHKTIRLITSFDVCYSGRALKGVLGNVKDEVFATDEKSALNITGLFKNPMIYISSASGEELSMQKKFKDGEHGVFTYYYFSNIDYYSFDTYKTYKASYEFIKKESAKACRLLKSRDVEAKCSEEGQHPLYIINRKEIDTEL